jgi:MoxR-like ATPase
VLPEDDLRGRDGPYLVDPGLHAAINVALTLDMPLLLTGEPGCGKTDFAQVVANALDPLPPDELHPDPRKHGLLECHVRSDTRARDLLYHYDALLRFGDAQHGDEEARTLARDPRHYIELQALGIALMSARRRVVLIDEIDKAPRDLPNDLLRELDRGEFEVVEIPRTRPAGAVASTAPDDQHLQRHMRRPEGAPRPIVIITSNVERQLPDPFLRRCVFYHIPFPDTDRLKQIVRLRYPDQDTLYLDNLVHIFESARKVPSLIKRPSTAELLSWVGALTRAFHPAVARPEIEAFHAALDDHGRVRAPLRWTHLPGVGCLFKISEDLEAADRHHASQPAPTSP